MKSAEEWDKELNDLFRKGELRVSSFIRAVQRDALEGVATQLEITAHNFNIEANDNIRKHINWEKRDEFHAAALIIRALIPKEPT